MERRNGCEIALGRVLREVEIAEDRCVVGATQFPEMLGDTSIARPDAEIRVGDIYKWQAVTRNPFELRVHAFERQFVHPRVYRLSPVAERTRERAAAVRLDDGGSYCMFRVCAHRMLGDQRVERAVEIRGAEPCE